MEGAPRACLTVGHSFIFSTFHLPLLKIMHLDPDIISKWDQRGLLRWEFIPTDVHVLEVLVYSDSPPRVHERLLSPAEFLTWIDQVRTSHFPRAEVNKCWLRQGIESGSA